MKFEQYLIESELDDLKKELKSSDDYLKAPNGKDSNLPEKQWLMVRTKAFKNWFGDWLKTPNKASKMVDDNGEPKIYYHGTGVDKFDDFAEYSYFTNDKSKATLYATQLAKNGKTTNSVYSVFLNCIKPKLITKTVHSDRVKMFDKSKTLDCVYNDITFVGNSGVYEYVVRNGKQVKSIDNKGSFSLSTNMNESTEVITDVTETKEFKKWFGKSKCVDSKGKPMVMFHGTPNSNFTSFKQYSHFTPDKEYADVYQSTSASSINAKRKESNNPKTIHVYLSIQNPFDTRKPEHRKIFDNEYYRKWGTGSPLTSNKLPDWADVRDLIDWIEEEEKPFDGIIVDEGSTDVKHRGFSWIPVNANQIKSVDNKGSFSKKSNNINENDE